MSRADEVCGEVVIKENIGEQADQLAQHERDPTDPRLRDAAARSGPKRDGVPVRPRSDAESAADFASSPILALFPLGSPFRVSTNWCCRGSSLA
jgi:hypothetical protein